MITRNRVSTALINTVPAAQSRFLNSPAFGWPSRKSTSPKSNRKAIDQSTDSTRTATEASNNVARDLSLESGSSLPSPSKRAKKATKTTQLPESVASTNPTSSSHCETESGDTIKKPVKVVKRSIKSKAIDDSEVSDAKQEVNAAKKPGKKTIEPGSLKPPEGWREIYDLTLELRKERDAPVDWAGSESLGLDPVTGQVDKYHVLIALMLSSQTKDQVVAEAMSALKARGLSIDSVLQMTDEELNHCIAKVGFHNNKTKFIKAATAILKERFGGSIPTTAEELCDLPGVGPKMAYIVLKVAHGIVSGIGVDTHMHRIFNQLGWVKSSTPEKTREQLEGWLPRAEWPHVNVLFVGLGQMVQQPAERAKLLRRCVDAHNPGQALRYVAKLGADINSRDAAGETCLIYAVRHGRVAAVRALLARPLSARKDIRTLDGLTALDVAAAAGREEMVALLQGGSGHAAAE